MEFSIKLARWVLDAPVSIKKNMGAVVRASPSYYVMCKEVNLKPVRAGSHG